MFHGTRTEVTVPESSTARDSTCGASPRRANSEVPRVRNELLVQLADAFERYENARTQTALYRERILPNLVTAFRGVYLRYQVEPDILPFIPV